MCPNARSGRIWSTASELSRVLAAAVHLMPLRADLEPARRDGRLRAVLGLTVLVIDKAVAPATVNGDSACVIHMWRVAPPCNRQWKGLKRLRGSWVATSASARELRPWVYTRVAR